MLNTVPRNGTSPTNASNPMFTSIRRIVGTVTPAPTPTTTITSDRAAPTTSPATGTIDTIPSNPTRRPGSPGTGNASSSIHENRRTHGGRGRELGTSLPRLRRISCHVAAGDQPSSTRAGTGGPVGGVGGAGGAGAAGDGGA